MNKKCNECKEENSIFKISLACIKYRKNGLGKRGHCSFCEHLKRYHSKRDKGERNEKETVSISCLNGNDGRRHLHAHH